MIVRVAMIASLVALPVLVSCRDNQERRGSSSQTTTSGGQGQGRSSSTYGGSAGGEGTSGPQAQRESGGVSGGSTSGTQGTSPSANDTTAQRESGGTTGGGSAQSGSMDKGSSHAGMAHGSPLATASLQGNLSGTVQFMAQDEDAKNLTAFVNVQGAKPGSYGVYLFKGTDCNAIKQMKAPFANLKEGADKKDQAGWKTVGSLSVAQGQEAMQLPVKDLDKKDLGQGQSVVIYPIDASAGSSAGQGVSPVACGAVRPTSSAGQPAG